MKRFAPALVFLVLALSVPATGQQSVFSSPFEAYLEPLRIQAGIPGMSAVIVHEGEVIWERGFGFQNVEARIRATPDTPYPVAGLSETIAAVLLLQCVEGRRLELDEPIERYGLEMDRGVTMRHLLSHTSSAPLPGTVFRYEPDRFARLTEVMEYCAPQPYRKSVSHRILERLAMRDSVPGRDLQDRNVVSPELYDPAHLDRYARVLERLAVPYKVEKRGRVSRTDVPIEGINAATGLVSTARDLARFDAALDTVLLLEETRQIAWTNAAVDQTILPAGLGWFVQSYAGERVVWQFGVVPNAYSSLILKIPSRRLTVILLANSDTLAAPFQLQMGDVTRSVFATLFLRLFL